MRGRMAGMPLDPNEVDLLILNGNVSGRRKASQPRSLDVTSVTLKLTHRPTGIAIEGEVPSGNHTKNRMRILKLELQARLFAHLEKMVAAKK